MIKESIKKNSVYKKMTSGIDFYYVPMENYRDKVVAVVFKSGGNAVNFVSTGNKNHKHNKHEINLPYGTAHFLEHKMFRQKWGDAFATFVKNGAVANAYTDAMKTVYYFKCCDNFGKNTKLILDMVQNPYFIEKEVIKEREIIASEITLYDDDPNWRSYYEMLANMYKHHPVKVPIAGDKNSIAEINAEVLDKSFELLYTTNKMAIVCVGDISLDFMLKEIRKIPKKQNNYVEYFKQELYEPDEIVREYSEIDMGLNKPIYQIGMKLFAEESRNFWEELTISMALDIWVGESSDFHEKALENGYIDEPLGYGYFSGEGYSFIAFSARGEYYNEVLNLMKTEYENIIINGISAKHFNRIRKKQIGKYIKISQSAMGLCMAQVEWAMHRITAEEVFTTIKKVRLRDIKNAWKNYMDIDNMVVSVVK